MKDEEAGTGLAVRLRARPQPADPHAGRRQRPQARGRRASFRSPRPRLRPRAAASAAGMGRPRTRSCRGRRAQRHDLGGPRRAPGHQPVPGRPGRVPEPPLFRGDRQPPPPLFSVRPACVVSDLHPGFHSTRWAAAFARKAGIPHLRVQHHHAHVLAAMLEHGLSPSETALGIAFDGYGYGADGEAWGAEIMAVGTTGFDRLFSFEPIPLPGGDLAARQPWRMALAYLAQAGLPEAKWLRIPAGVDADTIRAVRAMIARGSPATIASSCGRLFDAVSALLGLAPAVNEYEGEAAMRLEAEAAVGRAVRRYPFVIPPGPGLRPDRLRAAHPGRSLRSGEGRPPARYRRLVPRRPGQGHRRGG